MKNSFPTLKTFKNFILRGGELIETFREKLMKASFSAANENDKRVLSFHNEIHLIIGIVDENFKAPRQTTGIDYCYAHTYVPIEEERERESETREIASTL